jgi:hypothetical protein
LKRVLLIQCRLLYVTFYSYMLMQQLHYNLPLQKWVCDDGNNIRLEDPITNLKM